MENDVLKPIHKKLVEIEPTAITPKEIPVPPIAATSVNGFIGNSGKEKKKKKSEFNSLQQLGVLCRICDRIEIIFKLFFSW